MCKNYFFAAGKGGEGQSVWRHPGCGRGRARARPILEAGALRSAGQEWTREGEDARAGPAEEMRGSDGGNFVHLPPLSI